MKRWLVGRLQRIVLRLAEPVTTRLVDEANLAARETRDLHRATLARIEVLIREMARQDGGTPRELAARSKRDFSAVVRMIASMEARLADVQTGPDPGEQAKASDSHRPVPARQTGSRHVVFTGTGPGQENGEAAAVLTALRQGLDRMEDPTEAEPDIWIEGGIGWDEADHTHRLDDGYIRVMKGGTRSIEVLRPVDALVIRDALDRNRRSDVRVIFRWIGTTVPDAGRQALGRALACADDWIFPSRNVGEAVLAACPLSEDVRSTGSIHLHPLPEHPWSDPVALARAYRRSVAAVLDTPADKRSRPPSTS